MLNTEEDTEWNDILRQRGILPPKKVTPIDEPPSPPDPKTLLHKLSLSELKEKIDVADDEGLDEEDAKFFEEYRRKRLAMLREEASRARFGCVREVTKADWKTEVNERGDFCVVVHISQRGHFLCNLVDSYLMELARKFPMVKFLRGESSLCIPDYPECNLPTLLVYQNGDMKHRLIGPSAVGGKSVTVKGLEWRLAQLGVLKTKLTEEPNKRIQVSTVSGKLTNRFGRSDSDSDDVAEQSDSD